MNIYNRLPKLIVVFVGLLIVGVIEARRIAVVAYGSLVHELEVHGRGKLEVTAPFAPINVTFPVRIGRLSAQNSPQERFTAVIDSHYGTPKRLWAAESSYDILLHARQNLAQREGITNLSNLDRIPYIVLRDDAADRNEISLGRIGNHVWVMRKNDDGSLPLTIAQAQELAKWAARANYDAVIWANFPPTHSEVEVRRMLRNAPYHNRYINTQNYINNLADGPQSQLEKDIVNDSI